MAVTWEDYIWDGPRPALPEEIEAVEKLWGVVLPEDYKEVVARYQGMAPRPSTLDVGGTQTSVSVLLTMCEDERRRSYSSSYACRVTRPRIPGGLFPFARTPAGEFICFDYCACPPGAPKVVLVTVEADIHPVADGFSEFLEKLHE